MKKIYSILIVLFALVSLQTKAQLVCTATFTTQFLNGSTVKFNPSPLTLDSPNVQHVWYFNDGGINNISHAVSPTHIFQTGIFQVMHEVSRPNPNGGLNFCTDYSTQQIIVTQGACLLSLTNLSIYANANNALQHYYSAYYNYNQLSDSIRWTFGDGSSSNLIQPSHTYSNYGVYNVCLRVIKRNIDGTLSNCISEICKLDTVAFLCNLQAYFATNADSIPQYAPATIQFTNWSAFSNNSDSITWNFGDGTPVSHALNPSHIYTTPGTYTACIRVKRNSTIAGTPQCVSEFCKQIVINSPPPCNLVASYYSTVLSAGNPPIKQYFNASLNFAPGDSIRWTFGDGTISTDLNPVHTYSNYGVYNVCLRVKKPQTSPSTVPCVSEICHLDTVAYQCNLQAYFTNTPDSATAPATIQFANLTTTGNSGIANIYTWNFGDGTSSNLMNPSHVYTSPGTYTVCLHAVQPTTVAGTPTCSSDFCKQITITGPPCTLVANFNYYLDSLLTVPNSYHFTNTSSPLVSTDSIRWSFGDGTFSNQVNPNHIYTAAGTYNACLRVIKRTNGVLTNCVSEKCYSIVVAPINTCNLQVYFSSLADSTQTNIIHFTNQSIGYITGDSLTWSFGDGTSSNAVNPVHTYTTAGTYVVCLTIKKINTASGGNPCIRQYCKTIVVTVPCNLLATFTYFKDSSVTPAVYHFNNTTATLSATDSIRWSFGDGTFSNQVSPTHSYAQAGSYMVCLRVIRRTPNGALTNCVGEVCYLIVVPTIVTPCTLVSNFTWFTDSLPTVALNTVHFTNTSAPLAANDSIRWTFGDGTSSNQLNPAHVYTQPGTYTVCLRVIKRTTSGTLTNCVSEICKVVVVSQTQICNIVANYTWHADSTNPKNIIFTNTTIATSTSTTVLWSFGDGTTATTWNATHLYAQSGTYNVCLRIQYGNCVNYKCTSITIIAPPPVPTCAQLSQYITSTTNNTVVFAPNLIDPTVQYTWTFGDNTGAQGANATHIYATSGYYTACLTAYRNNSCATTTCKTIYIAPNCSNITLSISDVRDSLVPNRIKFTALSNTSTTDQLWTITRIPTTATQGSTTIHLNNPTYMFLDSGYYNVCVKATFANGCVKNICKTIYITQNMPGTNVCTLQAYPNPASSIVNAIVTLVQPQLINATIYNSQNAVVAQTQQQGVVGLNTISMNIANLPAGIYTIRVIYGTQVCYAPFVKQ
jgi:PKD repeat protein